MGSKFKFLLLLGLSIIIATPPIIEAVLKAGDLTYCKDEKLCPQKNSHITCNNDWQIAKKCRKFSKMYEFTSEEKQQLTDYHNQYRNTIAAGELKGYKSASRMATMQWDDELAQLAELNAKTCEFAHDKCRNTPTYRYSGQNLFIMGIFPKPKDVRPKAIKDSVDKWWLEYKDCDMSYCEKFRPSQKNIGHFTAMVVDRNNRLGCAAIEQNQPKITTVLLACNYASTNLKDFPLYKVGEPGADCKKGKNTKYPALCSPDEQYQFNTFEGITKMYS